MNKYFLKYVNFKKKLSLSLSGRGKSIISLAFRGLSLEFRTANMYAYRYFFVNEYVVVFNIN